MKTEELRWSLRQLGLDSATKLADGLLAADRIRGRHPTRNLGEHQLAEAVGDKGYTLGQSLVGSQRAAQKKNRSALFQNFRNLAPALIKQGHEGLLENLITHLSQDLVESDLRKIVTDERARAIREEEAVLWRRYVHGGTKALLAATTPAD